MVSPQKTSPQKTLSKHIRMSWGKNGRQLVYARVVVNKLKWIAFRHLPNVLCVEDCCSGAMEDHWQELEVAVVGKRAFWDHANPFSIIGLHYHSMPACLIKLKSDSPVRKQKHRIGPSRCNSSAKPGRPKSRKQHEPANPDTGRRHTFRNTQGR